MNPAPRSHRRTPKEVTLAAKAVHVIDAIPYSFTSPESKALRGASYDPDTEVLTVDLNFNNGTRYTYAKFPAIMWREFLEAPSKGTYFQQRIRPVFQGTKLD